MFSIQINVWALLVTTIITCILGGLWYGPLFGKTWMKLSGIHKPETITPAMKKMMRKNYAITFITSLIMNYVLFHALVYAGVITQSSGVGLAIFVAFWCWIGFIIPATIGTTLWEGKPWKVWFLNIGYYLVALVISGIIFVVW